jgi:ATP-dependent helicase HrpA
LFETRQDAAFYHATGIARLIILALKDSVKYAHKNLPKINHSALMYMSFSNKQELIDDIVMASVFECFLRKDLPVTADEFETCVATNRERFIQVLNEKAELVNKILTLYRQTRDQLQSSKISRAHRDDITQQCEYLVYEGFIREVPEQQLKRYPVYFQAIMKRIDKTQQDSTLADRSLPLIIELWSQYVDLSQQDNELIDKLRWMIEEFRISCFAQPMKTNVPVSENKIRKLIAEIN